ncbi:MAG: hypothetical protein ACRDJB_04275 [Actinomycetota bacterium]
MLALSSVLFLVSCEAPGNEKAVESDPAVNLFQELRRRPLSLPSSKANKPCAGERHATHIPGIPAQAALGKGPVYSVFPAIPRGLDLFPTEEATPFSGSRWRGAEALFVSEPEYDGPALIRGGQIDGEERLGFGEGETPLWELRLPAREWELVDELRVWDGERVQLSAGWRVQRTTIRIAADGCYAMQLDGESFSQVIEFGAELQPGPT